MTTKTPAGPPVRLSILLRDGGQPADVYAIIPLPGGQQLRVTAGQAAAVKKAAGQAERLIHAAAGPEILGLPEPGRSPVAAGPQPEPEWCDRAWHDGDCCPGSRKDWAARPADPGPAAPDEGTATAVVIEHGEPCTMAHCPVHHPPVPPSDRADGSVSAGPGDPSAQPGHTTTTGAARPFRLLAGGQ